MLTGFEKIVEARIKKAQEEGAFENLPGSGQPLHLEDDRHIPEDLRMAHKILKNADCLPLAVSLRKEIRATEDLLDGMTDMVEKYRTIKKINLLILKLNTIRSANAALDIPQRYVETVVDRLGGQKS